MILMNELKHADWVEWVSNNCDNLTIDNYCDETLSHCSFDAGAELQHKYDNEFALSVFKSCMSELVDAFPQIDEQCNDAINLFNDYITGKRKF